MWLLGILKYASGVPVQGFSDIGRAIQYKHLLFIEVCRVWLGIATLSSRRIQNRQEHCLPMCKTQHHKP